MVDQQAPAGPIKTQSGLLSGLQLPEDIEAFLGVPYAVPPIHDLRWKPPKSLLPWSGVRDANKYGPSSLQFPIPTTSLYYGGETEFSEDCLYLNVWANSKRIGHKPVIVWFHLGGFMFGSGRNPMYDGAKLAAKGIVVVTVNYRLGRFGFLAHPDLSSESGYQSSGNYGIMDQIAALQWVQRNIEAFGGDPGNVTIAGCSAGGSSVHTLRCSPLANGLFHKAICESGPGMAPAQEGHGQIASFSTLAAAEQAGVEVFDALGISTVAELRSLPAEKIMAAPLSRARGSWYSKSSMWPDPVSLSGLDTTNVIVDGHVLPKSPMKMYFSGSVADVPTLAGNADNEGVMYLSCLNDFLPHIKDTFGKQSEELLRLYPAEDDSDVPAASAQLFGDDTFIWSTWTSARLQARFLKSPVWYYKMARKPPIPPRADVKEKEPGAYHGAGIQYAFGNFEQFDWDWTSADRELSQGISDAWVRFMNTGNPNGGEGNEQTWPPLTTGSGHIMIWDSISTVSKFGSKFLEVMAAWDAHYGLVGVHGLDI